MLAVLLVGAHYCLDCWGVGSLLFLEWLSVSSTTAIINSPGVIYRLHWWYMYTCFLCTSHPDVSIIQSWRVRNHHHHHHHHHGEAEVGRPNNKQKPKTMIHSSNKNDNIGHWKVLKNQHDYNHPWWGQRSQKQPCTGRSNNNNNHQQSRTTAKSNNTDHSTTADLAASEEQQ